MSASGQELNEIFQKNDFRDRSAAWSGIGGGEADLSRAEKQAFLRNQRELWLPTLYKSSGH